MFILKMINILNRRLNYLCSPFYIGSVKIGIMIYPSRWIFEGLCASKSSLLFQVLLFSSMFSSLVFFFSHPLFGSTFCNHIKSPNVWCGSLVLKNVFFFFFSEVLHSHTIERGKKLFKSGKSTSRKDIEEKLSENTKLFKIFCFLFSFLQPFI